MSDTRKPTWLMRMNSMAPSSHPRRQLEICQTTSHVTKFGRSSSAGRQDCRVLFARQHEFDRLTHLLGVHTRANAERLVERCQDAYDHRHQHGDAAECDDTTSWAGGVVADEQKDTEKRTP